MHRKTPLGSENLRLAQNALSSSPMIAHRNRASKACACSSSLVQYSDGKFVYWLSKLKITKKAGDVPTFLTVAELCAHIANTHVRTLNGSAEEHAHDLIPDVAFIASMPLARQCPTEALDDMMKMRRAGQSVATIFTTLKVPQRIAPTQSLARPTPLWPHTPVAQIGADVLVSGIAWRPTMVHQEGCRECGCYQERQRPRLRALDVKLG